MSAAATDGLAPYDGVLLVSFGGPEAPEQVLPFLQRVTAGKGVPPERLARVAEHYLRRGGISPLAGHCRRLREQLRQQLAQRGCAIPVLLAYRHTEPSIAAALAEAHHQGLSRLAVVLTSAYPSYSGCRQYREDLAAAAATAAAAGIRITLDKLPPYAASPAFMAAQADAVLAGLAQLADLPDQRILVLHVTHSIPVAMDQRSGPPELGGGAYTRSHRQLLAAVTAEVSGRSSRSPRTELAFCSRSGPPAQPWLEPDVNDRIRQAAAEGYAAVLMVPSGFVSDHMEVVQDLDTEAAQTAAESGLRFVRVPTVGADPQFVAGLVDLLEQRAASARGIPTRSPDPTLPAVCRPGCCANPPDPRPASCGAD